MFKTRSDLFAMGQCRHVGVVLSIVHVYELNFPRSDVLPFSSK